MSYRLEIRPEALADIAGAAAWYEERESGLGERFTREVIATIDGLLPNPLIYRLRHRRFGARWCFPESFPYKIVLRRCWGGHHNRRCNSCIASGMALDGPL